VNAVSLDVGRGEFFRCSGVGLRETTTLRMVAGFEDPTRAKSFKWRRIEHLKPYQPTSARSSKLRALPAFDRAAEHRVRLRRRRRTYRSARSPGAGIGPAHGKESRYPSNFQVESGSAWRWPGRWYWNLTSFCWMSLCRPGPNLRKQSSRVKTFNADRHHVFVRHSRSGRSSVAFRSSRCDERRRAATGGNAEDLYLRRGRASWRRSWAGELDRRRGRTSGSHARNEGRRDGSAGRCRQVVQSTFLGNCVHVEARMDPAQPW